MQQLTLVMAFLGAVLVGFVVQLFSPGTPIGRALSFAGFACALYPVARLTWFRSGNPWRYFAGVAVGTGAGLALDLWRMDAGLSTDTDRAIGVTVVALATGCLLIATWKASYARGRHSGPEERSR